MKKENVYNLKFARIYPMLLAKIEKKGRTRNELDAVISWLTGYTTGDIAAMASAETLTYFDFFGNAPELKPERTLITGTICGVKIDEIEDDTIKEIRRLDKLVDELAKGKPLNKVLRSAKPTPKVYEFDAKIMQASGKGGAYIVFPYDIKKEFGKGRVKIHATFDGIPYSGSIVNMGVKDSEGNICYILGILKSIRTQLSKNIGDTVRVTVSEAL